jgi:hypothetical protein
VKIRRDPRQSLRKRARRGFRGYPVATIAYYGPDDQRASKVAVGIIPAEGAEAESLERWFSEVGDVRGDRDIGLQVVEFIRQHGARSVVATDRIIGCPPEEGIDYPEGETCSRCPFWASRDRWSGEPIQ